MEDDVATILCHGGADAGFNQLNDLTDNFCGFAFIIVGRGTFIVRGRRSGAGCHYGQTCHEMIHDRRERHRTNVHPVAVCVFCERDEIAA